MSYLKQQTYLNAQISTSQYMGSANTSSRKMKSLASGLTLTSLVDCFTILVAYLLVATSFGTYQIDAPKGIELPKSHFSQEMAPGLLVQLNGQSAIIDKKVILFKDLAEELILLKKKNPSTVITIQADKNADFKDINPVVLMGLNAGFTKVQFSSQHALEDTNQDEVK